MKQQRIEFIGVGEAFDPVLGNSSTLIHSSSTILVDCGYEVPRSLCARYEDPNFIDAIYFTHFHADHAFGFPALIGRMRGQNRTRPLTVIGQPGTKSRLTEIYELAYPGSMAKTPFPIEFIEFDECGLKKNNAEIEWQEMKLAFAELDHPLRNFGIRIEAGGVKIGISGDGDMTDSSRELFGTVDVLVHEAFEFERPGKDTGKDQSAAVGHSTVKEVVEFARDKASIQSVALVHIRRTERAECRRLLSKLFPDIYRTGKIGPAFIIPEPGDCLLA